MGASLTVVSFSIIPMQDAYDNAMAESTIGPFKTIADVEYATAGWVDWYNNRRLHTLIGDIPPAEFELNDHAATLTPQPAMSHT